MPRSSRKTDDGKHDAASRQSSQADVTLADFADSASPRKARMKKGAAKAQHPDVKVESKDALAWYEKELSDFDNLDGDEHVNDPSQLEDCSVEDGGAVRSKVSKKYAPEEIGIMYPVDLWFLIGRFVKPEDVVIFAAICQGSHYVTHCAQFWINLYARYYTSERGDLPAHLAPKYMQKVDGLCTRVIKSLYYLYPPFIDHVKCNTPFQREPDRLIGSRCILQWNRQKNKTWHFYFKFHRLTSAPCLLSQHHSPKRTKFARFAIDIMNNPEENCSILEVIMPPDFVSVPLVMGDVLHSTSLSVGQRFRYHLFKMVFTSQRMTSDKAAQASGTHIRMDPVMDIRVIHWWHPQYAACHQDVITTE